MRIGKKLGIISIVLVFFLLIIVSVLFFLIRQDDYRGKYQAAASQDLLSKVATTVGTGQETEINEQELNGFLAYLMEEKQSQGVEEKIQLYSLYMTLGNQEGQAGLYASCSVYGISVGVTARLQIEFDPDNQLFVIQFLQMKAGKLSVPPQWGLQMIQNHLPDGMYIDQDCLYLPVSCIKEPLGKWGELLNIQKCFIQEGKLFLQTDSLWSSVQEWGQQYLEDVPWESLTEEWESKGSEIFSNLFG